MFSGELLFVQKIAVNCRPTCNQTSLSSAPGISPPIRLQLCGGRLCKCTARREFSLLFFHELFTQPKANQITFSNNAFCWIFRCWCWKINIVNKQTLSSYNPRLLLRLQWGREGEKRFHELLRLTVLFIVTVENLFKTFCPSRFVNQFDCCSLSI